MEGSHQKGSNWYRCQYVRRRGSAAAEYAEHPQVLGVKEDNLLEPILSFLARRVFGPERLCLLRDELADATASTWEDHNTELERLQGELREIERSLRRQTLRLEERDDPKHPVVALAIERIEELSIRKAAVTDATQTLKTKRPAGHDPDEILAILDAVPDLRKVLNLASDEQLARIFRAFDVTITYDKPNRRLTLAATITPELIPKPELSPKPEKIPKREKGDHPGGRSRVGVSIPPPLQTRDTNVRPAGRLPILRRLNRRQVPPRLGTLAESRRVVRGRRRHVALGEDAFDLAQPLRGYLLLQALEERCRGGGADRRDVLRQALGV
jgi:hypothetical protein